MKKLLVSLLCVMMVFCMMPSMAFADDAPADDVYTVAANDGTLTIADASNPTASTSGKTKIEVQAGGTLKIRINDVDTTMIGKSDDTDALFKLKAGTVVLDLGENPGTDAKTVTLKTGADVEVPEGKKAYLMFGSGGPAINTVTESGATCTVNGVLKAVTAGGSAQPGSHVTIKEGGKLVVGATGELTISQFSDVTVESRGTLELPLMTKNAMVGTTDGTGMKGNIILKNGAIFKYGSYKVLGESDSMYASSDTDGSATLNLGGEKVKLTVEGDLQTAGKKVKTLFVHTDTKGSNTVNDFRPMDITVNNGNMTVAAGTTLDLVNGSKLVVNDGTLDIAGTMEIHSAAEFKSKADVSGTVYVFDDSKTTPAKGATLTLKGTGKVYAAAQDITAADNATITAAAGYKVEKNENANESYTSVSADSPTKFKYAYGAKATSSGGIYVPPTTDPLPPAKTESNSAVQNYVKPADYEDAEAAEIKAIMDKAAEDIKNAKTVEEVKAIEAAAKAEIDKLDTAEEKAVIRTVEATKFRATSKRTTLNGKKAIKITWNKPAGVDFDGYDIYRSTKKNSGFGTKPFFTTTKQTYTNNKGLEAGKTYYYKVRAYKYVNGRKVYSEYSYKAIRTMK